MQKPKVRNCKWCGKEYVRFSPGNNVPRGALMYTNEGWVKQNYPTSRFKKWCCRGCHRRAWLLAICNKIEREKEAEEKRRNQMWVVQP